jgi:hypothetical protein
MEIKINKPPIHALLLRGWYTVNRCPDVPLTGWWTARVRVGGGYAIVGADGAANGMAV